MTDDQHPDQHPDQPGPDDTVADSAADRPSTHGDLGMPAAGRRPADREPRPTTSDTRTTPPTATDTQAPPAASNGPAPPAASDGRAAPAASDGRGAPSASGGRVGRAASDAQAPAVRDAEVPVDPHAPLSADGPTIRLSKAGLVPPGDSDATPSPGTTAGEPVQPDVAGAEEPTVVSRLVDRDDEATTLLTPPSAPAAADRPAAHDDDPSAPGHEPTPPGRESVEPGNGSVSGRDQLAVSGDQHGEAEDEPIAHDGGSTMRLQPPFFAPGTTRTPRAKPVTDDRDESPAGPFDASVESRERWGSSPATPDSWMDSPAWPDDRTAGSGTGEGRDTPGRWQEDFARAAAAADERAARETPADDAWPSTGAGPGSADSRPGDDRTGPGGGSAAAASGRGTDRDGSGASETDGSGARSAALVDSPDPVTGHGDGAQGVPEKVAPWRRLSSAGALIWVLLALLGFTLVVQLQSNDDDAGLATARQEDLVGILSDLEARDQRLQQEINALEESQRQLTSGVAGRQAALAEAGKRADELGLLSGTLPARGPGLKITVDPKGAPIKASAILNAVQELRGAGGEVMEIIGDNGVAVRIVASSYFVDADGGQVIVDGKQLSGPYTVWVIGVPATMQTALQIPGGVVASVSQAGGNVTMEQRSTVEVTAVRQPTSLQYARPVS